ncbi:unnamed protein product [Chrysoparadoxa australica]
MDLYCFLFNLPDLPTFKSKLRHKAEPRRKYLPVPGTRVGKGAAKVKGGSTGHMEEAAQHATPKNEKGRSKVLKRAAAKPERETLLQLLQVRTRRKHRKDFDSSVKGAAVTLSGTKERIQLSDLMLEGFEDEDDGGGMELHRADLPPLPAGLLAGSLLERQQRDLVNLLKKLGARHHWREAIQQFMSFKAQGHTINMAICSAAMSVLGKSGRWREAIALLEGISRSSAPSLSCYNSALDACSKGGAQWQQALRLMKEMEIKGLRPDRITFNIAIACCARAGEMNAAFDLLKTMKGRGMAPNARTYTSILQVCGRARDTKRMEKVLCEMQAREVPLDEDCMAASMHAYKVSGEWSKVLELAAVSRAGNLELSLFALQIIMEACAYMGDGNQARMVLGEMRGRKLGHLEEAYVVAIRASGKGKEWEAAVALLECAISSGMRVSLAPYNAAIKACCANGQNALAAKLLGDMYARGLKPDIFSYNAIISGWRNTGNPEQAVETLAAMRVKGIKPDRYSYTAAILACSKVGNKEQAEELLNEMRQHGLTPDKKALASM